MQTPPAITTKPDNEQTMPKNTKSPQQEPNLVEEHLLRELAILLVPTLVFMLLINGFSGGGLSAFKGCGEDDSQGNSTSTDSACAFTHFLERPIWLCHGGIVLAPVAALITYRHDMKSLKRAAIRLSFGITLIIRCLSSFSGWATSSGRLYLVWNSNSPGKVFWLWFLVRCELWACTYLGSHAELKFVPVSVRALTSMRNILNKNQELPFDTR